MQTHEKIEYDVITGNRLDKFDEEINQRLAQGWRLQGGVSVAAVPNPHDNDRVLYTYVQAMIRDLAVNKKE